MQHNIRAEFEDGTFEDFVVGAPNLVLMRAGAAARIGAKYPASKRLVLSWCGQVVFVNSEPAEERAPWINDGHKWAMIDLFNPRSIKNKKDRRPLA